MADLATCLVNCMAVDMHPTNGYFGRNARTQGQRMIETLIADYWHVLGGAAVFLSGYGQLRYRMNQSEKADQAHSDALEQETQSRKAELIALETRLEKQRQEDQTQRKEDRDNTNSMLREVQNDIKLLLQRVSK